MTFIERDPVPPGGDEEARARRLWRLESLDQLHRAVAGNDVEAMP
jgi:hypothetical protein